MLQTRQRYTLQSIQDEVRALVGRGSLGKDGQLFSLVRFFEGDDWRSIELVLESHGYLLRDSICELVGPESWLND